MELERREEIRQRLHKGEKKKKRRLGAAPSTVVHSQPIH